MRFDYYVLGDPIEGENGKVTSLKGIVPKIYCHDTSLS